MSQLQLALAALAVLALLVLFIVEKWQEHRRLRRIRTHLHAGVGDALAPSAPAVAAQARPAAESPSRVEPVLGNRQVLPVSGMPDPAPLAPEASLAMLRQDADERPEPRGLRAPEPEGDQPVEAQALPTPVAMRNPGWIEDPLIDCSIEIRCTRPVDGVRLFEASAKLTAAGWDAPVHFVVWEGEVQQWVLPDRFGYYNDALASIQLANRKGCIDAAQLARFVAVIQEIAHDLDADVDLPDVTALAAQAARLDELCGRFDMKIGLSLVPREACSASLLRQAAQACGLEPAGTQRWVCRREFDLPDLPGGAAAVELFSLRLDSARPNGLLIEMDVALTPESSGAFATMVDCARRLAGMLDARLVDDNGNPIDDRSVQAIQTQLARVFAAMQEAGLPAGGQRARRLYL